MLLTVVEPSYAS